MSVNTLTTEEQARNLKARATVLRSRFMENHASHSPGLILASGDDLDALEWLYRRPIRRLFGMTVCRVDAWDSGRVAVLPDMDGLEELGLGEVLRA